MKTLKTTPAVLMMQGNLTVLRMRHNPGGYLCSVVAVAVLEYPEVPPALYARTRYVYDVLRANPVLWKEVAFAPTSAICTKEQLAPVHRSILKPSSLLELSDQVRLI